MLNSAIMEECCEVELIGLTRSDFKSTTTPPPQRARALLNISFALHHSFFKHPDRIKKQCYLSNNSLKAPTAGCAGEKGHCFPRKRVHFKQHQRRHHAYVLSKGSATYPVSIPNTLSPSRWYRAPVTLPP